ncbi:hypothetical protein Q4517_09760 [Tenacibaculum sp. 1_MG-2023]|nr:hypothetical protein [Tenacibaculum sp. 1_MG-2023]MDO6675831.1 hypothetical protein [Tenacibaculum sp. 1_MG-2023]
MKKSILNLGKVLNRDEQQLINGKEMQPDPCDDGCIINGICVSKGFFGCR